MRTYRTFPDRSGGGDVGRLSESRPHPQPQHPPLHGRTPPDVDGPGPVPQTSRVPLGVRRARGQGGERWVGQWQAGSTKVPKTCRGATRENTPPSEHFCVLGVNPRLFEPTETTSPPLVVSGPPSTPSPDPPCQDPSLVGPFPSRLSRAHPLRPVPSPDP